MYVTDIIKNYRDWKPGERILISAGCGTGKTKLTSIIANERLKKGLPVLFVSLPELYSGIKANFDKGGNSCELLEIVKKAECLILDDLGASNRTEWH